jgi:diketogulonate reductase-like aldo/keto reductase
MSSAAQTNLSSQHVTIHRNNEVGRGEFRIAYAGTYNGGQRNQQEAVCKCFKRGYKNFEAQFFAANERVVDKAIEYAEYWNSFCEYGKEILMTKGDVKQTLDGTKYLIEPYV